MDFMMGMLREDILIAQFFMLLHHTERIEKLTFPPEEHVNQNAEVNEWKQRGVILINF